MNSSRQPKQLCPEDKTELVKRDDTWELFCPYCLSSFYLRPHGALEMLVHG